MRVFKNTWFQRFARKEGVADAALCEAVARAARGQVDADLGGGVLKQRVARPGAGRSGGYRVILLFRAGDRALFAYGFAKADRANIEGDELAAFRRLAQEVLTLFPAQLDALVEAGRFVEVRCDGDDQGLSERSVRGDPRNSRGAARSRRDRQADHAGVRRGVPGAGARAGP